MHNSRNIQIDAMRGIAAIAVAIYHLKLIAIGGPLQLPWWLEKVTSLGGTGVFLFFTLSAYLLTKITTHSNVDLKWTLGFWVKRWFRIAPMFFFTFLIWALYKFYVGAPPFPSAERSIWTLSLLFNLSPSNAHSTVFAGWTVGVEILFYLIFPALFLVLKSPSQIALALVISLILRSLSSEIIARSGLPTNVIGQYTLINFFAHLPVFLIGMLLAKIDTEKLTKHANIYLLAAGIFILYANKSGKLPFMLDTHLWNATGAALLLYSAIRSRDTIATRIIAPLGTISFSIYLLHGPVYNFMGRTFVNIYSLGLGDTLSFLICSMLGMSVVFAASTITYFTIEKPCMKLGKRIAESFDSRKSAQPVDATP
ncbi:acyltransferase family protein [Pseudomonas xantholysinigenes]|uniref:Acyltransferase n=1 Tax=Pseudomonas xantholysinigenes TaxID=2745490 RepID=A0A9E6TYK7_9PSED|nr:acyltransferase [Pseudomonas xantholysinigenes]QXI40553.1 acyltransferase [Pseudomonas xantholysinigenes]